MNNDLEQYAENSFTDLDLEGMAHGNNPVANAYRELLAFRLAAKQAKPVAYMYRDNLHSDARFSLTSQIGNWSSEEIIEYEITEIPLYTTPHPAHTEVNSPVIPDGWVIAPKHVTSAMAEAGKLLDKRLNLWKCQDIYQAMLRAAPKPESE